MGVTGQQRMLIPPWHLILPSLLSKVRVALHSILYVCVFWTMITFDTLLLRHFIFRTYEIDHCSLSLPLHADDDGILLHKYGKLMMEKLKSSRLS